MFDQFLEHLAVVAVFIGICVVVGTPIWLGMMIQNMYP